MFEHWYMILSIVEIFWSIRFVARYVFLEPKLTKCGKYVYTLMGALAIGACWLLNEDIGVGIAILCPAISLFLARKKKRIRGFFLIIPILGVILGILEPGDYLLQILMGESQLPDAYFVVCDMLILVMLLLFLRFGKKWRDGFEQELQYRKLQVWERSLLVSTGWLACILYVACWDLLELNIQGASIKYLVLVIYVTVFLLIISVVGFVLRGNKKAYYEGIAKINEHYLEQELQHFEAYKLTQREVRRMQHDMKHHVISLKHLCKQGNPEEILEYLNEMGENLESGDMEINCGHVLASSICTHKASVAAQKGIRLEVCGSIPEQIALLPVDLCTILSNALDNCIEAVEKLDVTNRWIRVELSVQGEILCFRFVNPMKEGNDMVKSGVTTKADTINHGFGLLNIKYTVEKYKGQMLMEIEEKEVSEFVLSIIIGGGICEYD